MSLTGLGTRYVHPVFPRGTICHVQLKVLMVIKDLNYIN